MACMRSSYVVSINQMNTVTGGRAAAVTSYKKKKGEKEKMGEKAHFIFLFL